MKEMIALNNLPGSSLYREIYMSPENEQFLHEPMINSNNKMLVGSGADHFPVKGEQSVSLIYCLLNVKCFVQPQRLYKQRETTPA